MGLKSENILVAPDGVDLAEFDVDVSKEEARNKVGLPLDKNIVMYSGHLFEWKGASTLLEVARQCRDALFVLVGGMPEDIENFKKKARELMLNNVLILGHKLHKEIPIYLKAADVLVLPNSAKEEISRSYTSPLKLFEYMASGRPIVASDLPALGEVLNPNNSTLVNPDDSQELAGGIKLLLDKLDLGNTLAQKALEDVKNYTWTKRAKAIYSYF